MNIFQLSSRNLLPLAEGAAALKLYAAYCGGLPLGGRPGGATLPYLAHRVYHGATVEQAAAQEYLYRWNLALQSRVFGVPHELGL